LFPIIVFFVIITSMALLPAILTNIKSLYAAAVNAVLGLWRALSEKRRLVVIASGGGFVILLLIIAGLLKAGGGGRPAVPPAVSSPGVIIPDDELFLPEEPDFIPGVLPERERLGNWTVEDVSPWWQDPLKNGEESWRGRIEMTIDELLERVP
jgi:hypothetical protein